MSYLQFVGFCERCDSITNEGTMFVEMLLKGLVFYCQTLRCVDEFLSFLRRNVGNRAFIDISKKLLTALFPLCGNIRRTVVYALDGIIKQYLQYELPFKGLGTTRLKPNARYKLFYFFVKSAGRKAAYRFVYVELCCSKHGFSRPVRFIDVMTNKCTKVADETELFLKVVYFFRCLLPMTQFDLFLDLGNCPTSTKQRGATSDERLPTIGEAIPPWACAIRVGPERTADVWRPHANDNAECESDQDAKQQCRVPVEVLHALALRCNSNLPSLDGFSKRRVV